MNTKLDSIFPASPALARLVDSGDHVIGQRVATNRFAKWNDIMGQERIGADLTIAVDPANSSNVWLAWCDRVGGVSGTDWTMHVSHSTDRGQTWSADVRTVTNAKNPSLAVNSSGRLGLLYQQFTGTNWVTNLELTSDAWSTAATTVALHTASASTPVATFQPYIGDYVRLLAVGTDFYGVFCGNNTPARANFPNGVIYQRNANWATQTLLSTDNVTPVAVSIDPFFFHYSEPTSAWGASIQYDTGGPNAVALDDHGNAVEVHVGTDRLFYRVGTVDFTSKTIAWGASIQYDTGGPNAVALDDHGDVVEVHVGTERLFYRVGHL